MPVNAPLVERWQVASLVEPSSAVQAEPRGERLFGPVGYSFLEAVVAEPGNFHL